MPYNQNFDLRGKTIQNTYQNILLYDTGSNLSYNGQGTQSFFTASFSFSSSYAATASFTFSTSVTSSIQSSSFASSSLTSVSSSWASSSYSSSVSVSSSYLSGSGLATVGQLSILSPTSVATLTLFGTTGGGQNLTITSTPTGLVLPTTVQATTLNTIGTGSFTNLIQGTASFSNTSSYFTGSNVIAKSISGSNLSILGTSSFDNGQLFTDGDGDIIGNIFIPYVIETGGSTATNGPSLIVPLQVYQNNKSSILASFFNSSSTDVLFINSSGSINSSGNVTASLGFFGTASWASNVVGGQTSLSASYSSGSQVISSFVSASQITFISSSSNLNSLYDANGALVLSTGKIITTPVRILSDESGSTVLSFSKNAKTCIDTFTSKSIDWGNRSLQDQSQSVAVDWNNRVLSGSWKTNQQLTSSLNGTASWALNSVNAASGITHSISASYLSGSNSIANSATFLTLSVIGISTFDNGQITTGNGSISLGPTNGTLIAPAGIQAGNLLIVDNSGNLTTTGNIATQDGGELNVAGTTLLTGAVLMLNGLTINGGGEFINGGLTSSFMFGTASWASNSANAANASTSSLVVNLRDMSSPNSSAFLGYTNAPLNGGYVSFDGVTLGPVYSYLSFPNNNTATGNFPSASLSSYQMRTPTNYKNGLTCSFQYFSNGTNPGEIPNVNNSVYWIVSLYALTSSVASNCNFFTAPKLVTSSSFTQSFSGAVGQSGSVETITVNFTDPNGYITKDSILFTNFVRLDTDSTQTNGRDYSGSVNLISARYNWNS